MAYLIIPVLCFVLIGGLTWLLLMPAAQKVRKGKIEDLDVILSVLMTADWDGTNLLMKVPRRVTSVKMTFPGSSVRLEVPLVTRRQQSRKESDLAMLRDLGLDASISSKGGDDDVLEWSIEGTPSEASALVKEAFVRLFEVDPGRTLEFAVYAHLLDQNAIDRGLHERSLDDAAELPIAASQGRPPDSPDDGRAGCLKMLAGFLLLPVPFVIAYLQFGYMAASVVLVAILVARETRRRWNHSKLGLTWADAVKITALLLTGVTIYLEDPVYLQLVPTAVLLIVAAMEAAAISFNRPPLFVQDAKVPGNTRTARILLSFAVIATSIGGAASNEYLRTHLTLDTWIWIFAFVRIELFFGFLVSAIPFLYYATKNMPEIEGDTAPP